MALAATTSFNALASRRRSLTSSEVAARAVSPASRFLPAPEIPSTSGNTGSGRSLRGGTARRCCPRREGLTARCGSSPPPKTAVGGRGGSPSQPVPPVPSPARISVPSHGSGVPRCECLTPYELYLILELPHCGLCHCRSSQFSATIAVVRCWPGRDIAPALDQAQTGCPLSPAAEGSDSLVRPICFSVGCEPAHNFDSSSRSHQRFSFELDPLGDAPLRPFRS
jgi:hypothetical protein